MATAARDEGRSTGSDGVRSRCLPPEPASVPEARHFVVAAVTEMGAPATAIETELLVSELATNAVVHARTPMQVSVLVRGQCVRVEVRDDDPRLPTRRTPDPMAPGGRGIMLVEQLARRWGIDRDEHGKTVWFELEDEAQAS